MNMAGETDLAALLHKLVPDLLPQTYVFCTVDGAKYGHLSHTEPLASFQESEGLTLVLSQDSADKEGLRYEGTFRCVSLNVHSSLEAIGLTAVIASALARQNISANMIAGFYHDHLFVPSVHGQQALRILRALNPSFADDV